jgi:hypothetical protein
MTTTAVYLVRCGVTLNPTAVFLERAAAVQHCQSLDHTYGDAFVDKMEVGVARDPNCFNCFNKVYQRFF